MQFCWNILAGFLDLVCQADTVLNLEFILYSYRYRLVLSKFLQVRSVFTLSIYCKYCTNFTIDINFVCCLSVINFDINSY